MSEQEATASSAIEQTHAVVNKYDRPLATLDHNPLIAYFNGEDGKPQSPKDKADAHAMRHLFALQRAGVIRLMVTVSTMLEQQPSGKELDVQALDARLKALGLAWIHHGRLLKGVG